MSKQTVLTYAYHVWISQQTSLLKRINMLSKRQFFKSLPMLATLAIVACSSSSDDGIDSDLTADTTVPDTEIATSFFITSVGPGDGGNLGGLPGADVHCATLAEAAGIEGGEWRAYLSTSGADGVNAMDRIGAGPWVNVEGVTVATGIDNLLSDDNNLSQATSISESGELINGVGDTPNTHDILTGTGLDGTIAIADDGTASTCGDWTSNSAGIALVGHHDRMGFPGPTSTSWSSAHNSAGCSQTNLEATGGAGLFYCFAIVE